MTIANVRAQELRFSVEDTVGLFRQAPTDCQLVTLWQAYDTMGQAFGSVAPLALFSQAVQQLVQQVQQVSREEQIDICRDILGHADTRFTHAYQALNPNMKLAFWHRLFNRGRNLPWEAVVQRANRQADTYLLRSRLSGMGLNERIHFLRQAIA
ncbi:hypothetical protein GFS31_17170 [Leptolyngbya sp. BL0902]|uniref:orange carotenoid protein N-terminal domain-containing protein n=1 Tax=Leptolyngbya sp. BL0902 TaxID=1115757 RepID=UPI0018E8C52F|nr:orange carotenoid protein N-terminal domain-containing protein [Leptolyngbya sp. BL0902]QQE65032.1 hypothetical protein GFS31_17170 [Leptolyngbya sp. BL0902]